jgi:hypothetical protein
LKFRPFGKTSRTIGLLAVKNAVIAIFFAPIACLVLGMTSEREWATISEEGERY